MFNLGFSYKFKLFDQFFALSVSENQLRQAHGQVQGAISEVEIWN